MSFDGREVANFILDFCEARGRAVTNLSLQKILYFTHAWSLIAMNRPLIRHPFEAWQFGPVLQYLYREFSAYDRSPIIGRATRLNPKTGDRVPVDYKFDSDTAAMLNGVVDFYSQLSASDLVALSHAKDGPWYKCWHHAGKANPGMKIDNQLIKKFYSAVKLPYLVQ